MRKLLILLLLTTAGCAHTRVQSTTTWLDSFNPSGSFCIDAFSVNSASAGCKEWSSRQLPGNILEMRCTSELEDESPWTSSTFIFYHNNTEPPPLRHQPLCSDMHGIFSILIADNS